MALSVFAEAENFKKTKVTRLVGVGANTYANLDSDVSVPRLSRKKKAKIKRGVRLSAKYCAACRK